MTAARIVVMAFVAAASTARPHVVRRGRVRVGYIIMPVLDLHAATPQALEADTMPPAPVKPLVTIDALNALDIRIGTIREVADVAGSKKLVKLQVDFGDHQRKFWPA